MVLRLATCACAPGESKSDASVTFGTLVRPPRPPRRQPARQDTHLVATVAHELRNPLASLRLSLEMLEADYPALQPEAALRLIRHAQRSARWLHSLTENLSSTLSTESGHLATRAEPVDLRECIDDAVLLIEGLLRERGQTVRISISALSSVALADRDRTIQVLTNLLSNASRYSVTRDEIELHVSAVGPQLRVRVTDHGPGIAPQDQQRIFGAWVRGADSPAGGLGLGLSIVSSLVQQQRGRVGVESILGHGATFWFTLPVAS